MQYSRTDDFSSMNMWVVRHQLGMVGVEKLLIALSRNDYEPDVCFFSKQLSDNFLPGQMKFPVPDLVVEVLSPSTEERDRGVKFQDYALHGVGEYWIVDPEKCELEQYQLFSGQYELQQKSGYGTLKSLQMGGFQINLEAFFNDEAYLEALRQLMNT